MRIAVGGFQHETNTFAPLPADLAAFEKADAWPGLTRGDAMRTTFPGMNLPIAGFMEAASRRGHRLHPTVWASAEPSAQVTDHAFETITGMLADGLRTAGPIDAVYLDLHGAMVTESHEDGESEVLAVVRRVVGHDVPVVASLDLHANLSQRLVDATDALGVYRTYPHLDMAATGARCLALAERIAAHGRPAKRFRQVPFLTPLQAQYTGREPARSLYLGLDGITGGKVWSADIASGFPAADIRDAGPAVIAYADDPVAAEAAVDTLWRDYLAAESHFDGGAMAPDEAVRRALATPSGRPVVLADIQDNAGAGATSDTTGLVKALLAGGARGAVVGLLHDPEIAALAHRLGPGARFEAALGARLGGPGDGPLEAPFRVEALGDGTFPFTGEMYAGITARLGPTALLEVLDERAEVRIAIGSERCQCLDQAIFRHLGVELERMRIIGVKSTVHFRADFEALAAAVWPVVAPGANPCRLHELRYRNLRDGVRLGPGGPEHRGPGSRADSRSSARHRPASRTS